jgi:hypothetical protein
MVDASQMRQLMQNLLSNAIKFRGEQPLQIHISARREENSWMFSIRDSGQGIEPQYFERILLSSSDYSRATSILARASAWRSARRSSSVTAGASGWIRKWIKGRLSTSRSLIRRPLTQTFKELR